MTKNATGGAVWVQEMENGRKVRYIQDNTGRWVQCKDDDFPEPSYWPQDEPIPMHHLLKFIS